MRIFKFSPSFLLALAASTLLGCAAPVSPPASVPLNAASLVGVEWIASVVDGVEYLQAPKPRLRWTSTDALSGTGGCNAFAGRAAIAAQNSLRIGSLVPTGKLCMTEPGAQEDMFFKAIELTRLARLESGQLILLAEDGRVLLRMSRALVK